MEMELTKEFVNSCRKVGVLRDFLCQAIDQVDEKDKEIAELKEERRWRKFSEEKPKDKQLVLVHGDNWFEIAIYHDNGLIDFGDDIHFSNITETPYWMPPPSAPKEQA